MKPTDSHLFLSGCGDVLAPPSSASITFSFQCSPGLRRSSALARFPPSWFPPPATLLYLVVPVGVSTPRYDECFLSPTHALPFPSSALSPSVSPSLTARHRMRFRALPVLPHRRSSPPLSSSKRRLLSSGSVRPRFRGGVGVGCAIRLPPSVPIPPHGPMQLLLPDPLQSCIRQLAEYSRRGQTFLQGIQ